MEESNTAVREYIKSLLTSLVANKVSRRYCWVNAQTDKNLASNEYLNIEYYY